MLKRWMMKYQKSIKKHHVWHILIMFIVMFSILSSVFATTTSVRDAIKFILFQIGGIIVPGLAMLRVFPLKYKTQEEKLLFAYVDGYVLSMMIYLLIMILDIGQYVRHIYALVSVCSVLFLLLRHKDVSQTSECNYEVKITPWIFLGVLLVISWLLFSVRWDLSIYETEFHDDILFWIGDIISLEKRFLPVDFRTLIPNRKYHYGGAMQIALMCKVTGLSAFNMAVHYSYIPSVIIFVFSAYCLGKRVLNGKRSVCIMLFLILFSTGVENVTTITYFWHIIIQPMSFNVAYGFELVMFLLLIMQKDSVKIEYAILIRIVLSMATCTITKGPSGAIGLCAIGVMCVWWLTKKREIGRAFLYGGIALLAFGMVYLFLADINAVYVLGDTAEHSNTVSNTIMTDTNEVWRLVKKEVCAIGGYIKYLCCVNPWTFITAFICFAYTVKMKRTNVIQWICVIVILIGTILGYTIKYVGYSQMYFALAVYPFAALLTGIAFDEIENYLKKNKKIKGCFRNAVMIVGCGVVLVCSIKSSYGNILEESVEVSISNLLKKDWGELQRNNKYDKMEYAEYEAYEWIRLNTDDNAIFLSDRSVEEEIHSRIPGVFCEKYIYKVGEADYTSIYQCFAGNAESVSECAQKGIRYIIQNKNISPNFSCPDSIGNKLYENNIIAVYELIDSSKL